MGRKGVSDDWSDEQLSKIAFVVGVKNYDLQWWRKLITTLEERELITSGVAGLAFDKLDDIATSLRYAQEWHGLVMRHPPGCCDYSTQKEPE